MKNQSVTCAAVLMAIGSLAFPIARAVSPAPDGGYAGNNTAEGTSALFNLSSGIDNTGLGFQALFHDSTGNSNTAEGFRALFANTNGHQNTATGFSALSSNTVGNFNTANGVNALNHDIDGGNNTATGVQALFSNTSGNFNTATGVAALFHNINGTGNTAVGNLALGNLTNGVNNIALGNGAGDGNLMGDNNVYIGNGGSLESATIRIGIQGVQTKTFVAGIYATTTGSMGTLPVIVDMNGQLGTFSSSRRFKKEIKPMDQASEAILALKPVTFQYKSDNTGTPQFGLIAEEVAEVNPDLVVRDKDCEIYTVRYDAVNAMLLNEFLKEHKTVQEQQAVIGELNTRVAQQEATSSRQRQGMEVLTARLKEQAAQIQKVSARQEMNESIKTVGVNSR